MSPKQILMLNTIIFGLGFIPSLVIAAVSLFIFDAPGSTEKTSNWILFSLMFTQPIVIVISMGTSWYLYNKQIFPLAAWISSISWLYVFFWIIVFLGAILAELNK